MLRSRETGRTSLRPRADSIAAITVLLLCVCAGGLLIAGVMAVYDYTTPGAEAPLALGLTVTFGVVLALNIVVATIRHFSRR